MVVHPHDQQQDHQTLPAHDHASRPHHLRQDARLSALLRQQRPTCLNQGLPGLPPVIPPLHQELQGNARVPGRRQQQGQHPAPQLQATGLRTSPLEASQPRSSPPLLHQPRREAQGVQDHLLPHRRRPSLPHLPSR